MKTYKSICTGREILELTVEDSNEFSVQIRGIGDWSFLKQLIHFREQLIGIESRQDLQNYLKSLEVGKKTIFDRMLIEVLMKALGQWEHPFSEEELCHCRVVPTQIVDSAILAGCETPQQVSRRTNASTQCGTCRPDVEKILSYRR